MMIDTILFDYDGTIVDTNNIIIESLGRTSRYFLGRDLTESEFYFMFGKPLEVQMDFLLPDKAEAACRYYMDEYNKLQDKMVVPFPSLRETLAMIKESNIKTGIVSSKSMEGITHGLKKFGFGQYIDAIISSDDTSVHKPDPTPLLIGLNKLGSTASNTLMVGDSPYDAEASKRAGIRLALVSWSLFPEHTFTGIKPDYTIENLYDLVEISSRTRVQNSKR